MTVAAVTHQNTLEHGAEFGERHGGTFLMETESQPIHDVQVTQAEGVELLGEIEEGLTVVIAAHIVEDAVGRQTGTNPGGFPDLEHGLHDLAEETEPVFQRAAVWVVPLIGT